MAYTGTIFRLVARSTVHRSILIIWSSFGRHCTSPKLWALRVVLSSGNDATGHISTSRHGLLAITQGGELSELKLGLDEEMIYYELTEMHFPNFQLF